MTDGQKKICKGVFFSLYDKLSILYMVSCSHPCATTGFPKKEARYLKDFRLIIFYFPFITEKFFSMLKIRAFFLPVAAIESPSNIIVDMIHDIISS